MRQGRRLPLVAITCRPSAADAAADRWARPWRRANVTGWRNATDMNTSPIRPQANRARLRHNPCASPWHRCSVNMPRAWPCAPRQRSDSREQRVKFCDSFDRDARRSRAVAPGAISRQRVRAPAGSHFKGRTGLGRIRPFRPSSSTPDALGGHRLSNRSTIRPGPYQAAAPPGGLGPRSGPSGQRPWPCCHSAAVRTRREN